ncbi:MAG: hypothetical protein ACEQSA_03695 [Weeksellaceae bacterium]
MRYQFFLLFLLGALTLLIAPQVNAVCNGNLVCPYYDAESRECGGGPTSNESCSGNTPNACNNSPCPGGCPDVGFHCNWASDPPTSTPQPPNPTSGPQPTSPPQCDPDWTVTCCDGSGDSLSCPPGPFSSYNQWANEACGNNGGHGSCEEEPTPEPPPEPTGAPPQCGGTYTDYEALNESCPAGGSCGGQNRERDGVWHSTVPGCGQIDDCGSTCGGGPQPTRTPTPSPTPACAPPSIPNIISATCNASNSEATLSYSSTGASSYAIRIDRDPTSFNTSCSPTSAGDTCINSHNTNTYTTTVPNNSTYRAWVHGISSCGAWSLASPLRDFSCHKGIVQGRRVGALGAGNVNLVYRNSATSVSFTVGDVLMSNHNDSYNSGQTLKTGNTYEILVTPPVGYDKYSSLCVNCTTHNSTLFAGDGSAVQHAYQYGTRVAQIPTTSVPGSSPPNYFNDLYWMFVPRLTSTDPAFSGGTGSVTTIPPATAGLSGLKTTNGGSNYFNGLQLTQDFTVATGDLDDVSMVAMAFVPSTFDTGAICKGDTGRKYVPYATLKANVATAKGVMLVKVYRATGEFANPGYYLFNGFSSTPVYTPTTNTLIGNPSFTVSARMVNPTALNSTTWRFTSALDLYPGAGSAVRGNQNWKAIGHIRTSTVGSAPERDYTSICN